VAIPFPAHVLIADDHAVVREGLRAVLEREPDLTVVAEVGDGAEALERGLSADVHLAILDIAMPRMTGLQAARELSKRRPDLQILILSMYDKEQYFFEALTVGASGYVLKRAADRDIVDACRRALRGEPFIYPTALRTLMRRYLEAVERGETPGRGPLTPREEEIVKLIAEGRSSQEIADLLVISPKTVERHRANILEKLAMRDRVDLTRYAIREGLVEP
jgi:DNA-binding NarL/FixJ family response regulator